jgi:hypothetical protein
MDVTSRRGASGRRIGVAPTAAAAVMAVLAVGASAAEAAAEPRHPSPPTADAVIAWNENAGEAALAACIAPADNPLHESRMYAMMHIAIHDALNAIDPRYQPYAASLAAPATASPEAAVAAAAGGVLDPLLHQIPAPFPPECGAAGAAQVEADYAAAIAAIPAGTARTDGVAAGEAAAAAILSLRAADGSDTPLIDESYSQGTAPAEYRFTPGTPFAFAPGWANVTPFMLKNAEQFRPPGPVDVTSRRYARDVNEVKRLGGDGVTTPNERSEEQTEIALFWLESSPLAWTGSPAPCPPRRG